MFTLLLGHLTGDYFLQTQYLARNKSRNTLKGWMAAFIHCVIYTASVCLFMWNFDLIWIVVVFLSHFPIDKFSLADVYMKYITGGDMKAYANKVDSLHGGLYLQGSRGIETLLGGFTTLRYLIIDNGLHILIMWGAYQIIY
jgi:hypothetical protein